jgi:hypothetical protein
MILTEQVANFVCKYMSKKPFGLNAKLLSIFYDPEVKHVDWAGCSIFVAGGRRSSQVLNACLYSPHHLRRPDIQQKSIRAPVRGTPGMSVILFLRNWTIHPPRLDFGLSQNARGDCCRVRFRRQIPRTAVRTVGFKRAKLARKEFCAPSQPDKSNSSEKELSRCLPVYRTLS